MNARRADIIPRADGDFTQWANKLVGIVNERQFDWSLNPVLIMAINDAATAWGPAYAEAIAARAAAEAATQNKQEARAAYEAALRPLIRQLQTLVEVTDADRASLGITIRAKATRSVPPPKSRPVAIVSAGERLTHALRLVDEASPSRTARPRGAARAELFVALTAPNAPAPPLPSPTGAAGGSTGADTGPYRYVGSVSDGATTLSFDAAKGGQQAHYIARWVNTAGTPGPWSDTASATVAA